jgi:hypothetical protein
MTTTKAAWEAVVQHLRAQGVPFDAGLTSDELAAAEAFAGAAFPAALRGLLGAGLLMGPRSPDWRLRDTETLRAHLDAPIDGLLDAVAAGRFWSADWGERPADPGAASDVARRALAEVPTLLPIHGRRFLPAAPDGAPVFDVRGPVALFFGVDLRDYLYVEFGEPDGHEPTDINNAPDVPFWSDLADFWGSDEGDG